MKFYSGKGDKGTTTLFGSGRRLPKTDDIFEALGALDELNSYLGICISLAKNTKLKKALNEVQENLFIIQADVGNFWTSDVQKFSITKIQKLEKTIDKFGDAVGVITKFTLSGGTTLSTHLDYARTLARKAERKVVGIKNISPTVLPYLNRLSSLLFVLARFANKKARIKENNPSYK